MIARHNKNLTGAAKPPLSFFYPAEPGIFPIKIPYPFAGAFTSTWVTAPMILPA